MTGASVPPSEKLARVRDAGRFEAAPEDLGPQNGAESVKELSGGGPPYNVGRFVQAVRRSNRLTQHQLAVAMRAQGVTAWTQAKVSRVECGRQDMRMSELYALGRALNLGLEVRLVRSDEPPRSES